MSGVEILLDSHHGVYIPQIFAENCIPGWVSGSEWDLNVLKTGPDPENDSYWDVWTWVVDNATHIDKQGNTWKLYQDGDLFAYCEELMTDEEKTNLWGEF